MKNNNSQPASRQICLITNIGPHYRLPIFKLIEQNLECDFYIGDQLDVQLNTFDYTMLERYKRTLHNYYFGKFYWQHKSVGLVSQPYDYYILDGEPFCLSSWAILLYSKLKGKTTVCWSHGWYGRERGVKKIIKKAFLHLFDRLMLYNEYAIEQLEGLGFNRKNLYCIANSMDSDSEKVIRSQLHGTDIYSSHFGNENPTVLYCGRIQKRKKLEMLIDSIRLLKDKGITANLTVIGKDVDGVNLEKYAKECDVDNQVWMYGPCYDNLRLGELFYNASVCVSPGNIGLTAIHSLSYGCPAVTHGNFPEQMPEFEAIIPGKTGDFFVQDDVENLTEVISRWLNRNSEERTATRQECYAEIDKKWNIHHQIDVLKQVIYGRD